ncbi:hypothetical protein [Rubritalea tangerina]|uniref:Uncharacterized protein n=1 Tax=Rubritalea tangerina TaxID=430798 RepID=A0ABW4Z9Y0_9BACT
MKHWPVYIALALIYLSVWFEYNFLWGILFISWTIPAFYTKEIHLIQTVRQNESPFLFWTIVLTWIILSIWMILLDIPNLSIAP